MSEDLVRLDFPRRVLEELDDGHIAIVLPRDRLAELRSFLWALEVGLVETHVTPAGQG